MFLGTLLGSCGDAVFQQAYDKVKGRAGQADFLGRLVALDQRFPDRLALKVDLGAYYLTTGNADQAQAYLDRGAMLARSSGDENLKSILWADLAETALLRGDAEGAIGYADRALSHQEEKLGVIFTRAKAKLLKNDGSGALGDFRAGWLTRRSTMTAQDFGLFARTLVVAQDYSLAFEVLEAYRKSFPYESGTGLVESVCHENLRRYNEAVLSAFVDVIYQQSRGQIGTKQVLANLGALEVQIKARGTSSKESGLETLKALEAWTQGHWSRVVFDPALVAASLDARFFQLAALIETGRAQDSDLKAYGALENRFRDFPSYYLPLVRYFKDARKDGDYPGFPELAEKVVNLAPLGPAAQEGRGALARGYGLPPASAQAVLTRSEVDQALGRGELSLVLPLLGLADNPSTQRAVDRLTTLARGPAWRATLSSLQVKTSGRTKERLNLVLSNR